jgi:hypothetical protein
LQEAFYIARSGRPGPVHVDIPKDVTAAIGEFARKERFSMMTYKPQTKGNPRQIAKAIETIKQAEKPLFYIGGGAVLSNASKTIRELVQLTQIPAVQTLAGLGVLRDDDPLYISMLGMHGSYAANMAMSEADVIIALGARFDDRVTGKLSEFGKNAKIIHVDMDYFFAQVEELDNPLLKNKPLAVGGTQMRGGVLCTANYVARKLGVRSAMPTFIAIKKCPELIILPPNMAKYKAKSKIIFEIFHEYTHKVDYLKSNFIFVPANKKFSLLNKFFALLNMTIY